VRLCPRGDLVHSATHSAFGVLIVKTGVSPVPSGSLRSGFQVRGHDFGCIGVCLSAAKSVLLSAVKLPAAGHVQLVHDAEGWMC
jgi:hypothetical protein